MSTSIEDRLAAAGHELDRRIAARVARTASGPASIAASPMGGGSRRTWSLIAIGAVAATAVVVGTVLLTRDGNRSITPATSTITATTNPLPSSTTSPSTSPSTLPSTSVPPASVPSTSSAPTTPPAPPVHRTVQLADVMRDGVAQRTVLYTADVGAGVNQLGREDCQECEPTTPWTPVLLPDGTLVIADMNNSRWVVVRDGAPAAHPFPDGRVPIAQPVADDDGTVYSVDGYYQAGPAQVSVVSIYRDGDLSAPAQQVDVPAARVFSRLELRPGEVLVNGSPVPSLSPSILPLPEVTYSLNRFPATIEVRWANGATTWGIPPTDLSLTGLENAAQPDGNVIVDGFDWPTNTQYLISLKPDGTAVRAKITGINMGTNGSTSISPTGIIRLELVDGRFEVAHYTFPT